jgi:hypothetical protein
MKKARIEECQENANPHDEANLLVTDDNGYG